MGNFKPKFLGLATLTAALISTSALAGGFSRGGVNIDQLFDQDRFSSQAKVTYVNPKRTIKNVTRADNSAVAPSISIGVSQQVGGLIGSADPAVIGAFIADPANAGTVAAITAGVTTAVNAAFPPANTSSIDIDGDFWVPSAGIKVSVTDSLNCLATYSQPYGADSGYGKGNAYSASVVDFYIDTEDYGLTCGYSFGAGDTSVGEGKITLLGGVSYMEFEGFLSRQSLLDLSALPAATVQGVLGAGTNTVGVGTFKLEDSAVAWRIGAAYEIPEIALRAQIVYSSEYEINATGTVNISDFGTNAAAAFPTSSISASTVMPQSIEAKLQSGIREGTLAFASFKWEDWSELGSIPVAGVRSPRDGTPAAVFFEPLYRDGYTISAGIGQALTENLSGLVSLTWDRGTSTTSGTQTDSWTLSSGLRYKEGEQIEISVGGAIGILEGGISTGEGAQDAANAVTYSFDQDYISAFSASMKYKF